MCYNLPDAYFEMASRLESVVKTFGTEIVENGIYSAYRWINSVIEIK